MNLKPHSLVTVTIYYVLACLITWTATAPAALAFAKLESPSQLALAGAGLSAFGPLLAALILSFREGSVRSVFARWRTHPSWVYWTAIALLTPILLRIVAAVLTALFGFQLSQWVYPPTLAAQFAALVIFPLGEEFGWRGFAYPRLRARFGTAKGSLVLGVMWSFWHLGYIVGPSGSVNWSGQLESLLYLPFYSLILSWFFERTKGSMAVAIAFHAAAHLNHIELAPADETAFRVIHVLVAGVGAFFAARSLMRTERKSPTPS